MVVHLVRAVTLILSFAFAVPVFAATTVTLQEGLNGYVGTADNHAFDSQPTVNRGGEAIWIIGHNTNMGLMRFAIFAAEGGPVPDGATVTAATLSLYKSNGPDAVLRMQRILKSWSEMQSSWNLAASGSPWEVPGATGAGDVAPIPDFEGSIGSALGWVDIDVTAAVRAFAADPGSNHGWRVAYVSGGTASKEFVSRNDSASPALRPKLTVTYDDTTQGCSSGPFGGTAAAVPGEIEAENFDCGGEGVAYHDLTPTNDAGSPYRPDEAVDIAEMAGGGRTIRFFDTGEWMAYTIDVPTAGSFKLAVSAAHNATPGTYRIEIDGIDVTGEVTVPATGSWETYAWVEAPGSVTLSAGSHVLTLVSTLQSYRVDKVRVTPAPADCNTGTSRPFNDAPVNGEAIPIPGSGAAFESEHFNCGAEGAGYHDNTAGNQSTSAFRSGTSVDIMDMTAGGRTVQFFDTGEWMEYTIDVATAGQYTLGISAAHNATPGIYRIEVDGVNATGDVTVSGTGSWDAYQWFDAPNAVTLGAGQHVLRLVSVQQSFRVEKLHVIPAGTPPSGLCPAGNDFCASFENGYAADGFGAQIMDPSRARTVSVPGIISGMRALELWTSGSDCGSQVRTTCPWERAEITLTPEQTGGVDTADDPNAPSQWWAHSVYTPADFHMPPSGTGGNAVLQFHAWNTPGVPNYGWAQPNVIISFEYVGASYPSHVPGCPAPPGGYNGHVLYLRGSAGSNLDPNSTTRRYIAEADAGCRQAIYHVPKVGAGTRKQLWYDFVHHIKWASHAPVGFHTTWLRVRDENGTILLPPTRVMHKTNIYTKYPDKPVYFKTGTYHDDYQNGAGSVVHDRVVRGPSFAAVAPFACPAGDALCQ